LAELVRLGQQRGVPVVNDLGSGVFVATRKLLGYEEPTVQDSVRAGAALTCFSGDKMLGGMQAGLIVGNRDLVQRLKKNPIFRTVRVDKVVFSVLEKLLMIYLNGTHEDDIKLWQILALRSSDLRKRAGAVLKALGNPDGIRAENTSSFVGGGALPEQPIPSVGLVFSSAYRAEPLMKALRDLRPSVIGRIDEDRFILDMRTVDPDDFEYLVAAVKRVTAR
jgi:L-seryl-tRNA(Ser) seleniumtransferase